EKPECMAPELPNTVPKLDGGTPKHATAYPSAAAPPAIFHAARISPCWMQIQQKTASPSAIVPGTLVTITSPMESAASANDRSVRFRNAFSSARITIGIHAIA